MNIFEKLLVLKQISFSAYIKEEALIKMAAILTEQTAKPGESIIKKGEFGDEMFIIVSGKVKIHDEDRIIKELDESEVFGELAALSPEKRNASITALEETFLLKIGYSALNSLMTFHPELSRGIILFLCQKLRNSQDQLNRLITQETASEK